MLIAAVEIVEKSWELYKKNWRALAPYLLLLLVPSVVLAVLGVISLFLTAYVPASALVNSVIILVIVAAAVVFALWASIALALALKKLARGEAPEHWQTVFNSSSRYLWPVIYTSILVAIIVFLGTLLLIIPGIIFGVWYAFTFYQVVFEDKAGGAALAESKKLVVGRWWAVLWRLFLPAVIFGLLAVLLNYLLALPLPLIFGDNSNMVNLGEKIISGILNVLVSPLTALSSILLYFSAKDTAAATPNLDEIK